MSGMGRESLAGVTSERHTHTVQSFLCSFASVLLLLFASFCVTADSCNPRAEAKTCFVRWPTSARKENRGKTKGKKKWPQKQTFSHLFHIHKSSQKKTIDESFQIHQYGGEIVDEARHFQKYKINVLKEEEVEKLLIG